MILKTTLEWSKDEPRGGKRQYLNAVAETTFTKTKAYNTIGPVAWIDLFDALLGDKAKYAVTVLGTGKLDKTFTKAADARTAAEEHVILTFKGI